MTTLVISEPPLPVTGGALTADEVRQVQMRLRELGYHTVGKVDGVWGPMTTGAIASLQAEAGLQTNGIYTDETKDAMATDRFKRVVSPSRALTTTSDLRREGSDTIRQADGVTFTSAAMGVISLVIAFATFIVENWGEAVEMSAALRPFLAWVPNSAWPVVITLVAAFLYVKGRNIKTARVEAERTGVHNGEPSLPPA